MLAMSIADRAPFSPTSIYHRRGVTAGRRIPSPTLLLDMLGGKTDIPPQTLLPMPLVERKLCGDDLNLRSSDQNNPVPGVLPISGLNLPVKGANAHLEAAFQQTLSREDRLSYISCCRDPAAYARAFTVCRSSQFLRSHHF